MLGTLAIVLRAEARRSERLRTSTLTGAWCSTLGGSVCFLCGHDNSAQWAPFRSYLIKRVAICNQCFIGLTLPETMYRCDHCNLYADASGYAGGESLRERGECHNCNHWLRLLRMYPYPKRIAAEPHRREYGRPVHDTSRAFVVGGRHYMVDMAQPIKNGGRSQPGLGFGGATMRIRFDDGTEVTSNDVWYQGTVPDRFRLLMPDNATFIRDQEATR